MTSKADESSHFGEVPFAFASGFLDDRAGHIVSEPGVALIELIANSYDAGATRGRRGGDGGHHLAG